MPNRNLAMLGAFLNRFAIGFLVQNTTFQLPGWSIGLLIGLLLSLPDAIITGASGPILGFGTIGGVAIGFIVVRNKK